MVKKKKEGSSKKPKPRHAWKINPKTRVKPSGKLYKRQKAKHEWVDRIDWFGEKEG